MHPVYKRMSLPGKTAIRLKKLMPLIIAAQAQPSVKAQAEAQAKN